MEFLRRHIEQQIRQLIVVPQGQVVMDKPLGDPGLFGPDAVVWEVHRDFTCMMIGGMAALLLQMLHPLALAGVWDHSSFRTDLQGRLRRTSQFVGGTTYASSASVDWLIARVRKIHQAVKGHALDGRPYSATDPALLCWVHSAEVYCFLTSYRRYFNPHLPGFAQDRYYDEVARVALLLGAEHVPRSVQQLARYLHDMQTELDNNERTQELCRLLYQPPTTSRSAAIVARIFFWAAVDLLPDWAQQKLNLQIPAWRVPLVRATVRQIGTIFRWSYRRGAYHLAHQRMALTPRPPHQPADFSTTMSHTHKQASQEA